jgi:PPOX class probable F420-dependent enzyme
MKPYSGDLLKKREKVKMTDEELQTLLSKPNNAIVGVNRESGSPQLTPVWFAWDGKSFFFSTTKDCAKYWNIKRDPSISLIVDDFEMHKYLTAYGKAEVIEDNFGELLRPILQKYVPENLLEQRVKAIESDPSRVIVVLHPEKIVTGG